MSLLLGEEARTWLARSLGTASGDLSILPMRGSTSSSLYLVICSGRGKTQRFVLRVLDNARWLASEPDLAAHEAMALEEARKAGVRAPELIAYSSDDVGFGAPVVLMSYIEGRVELRPRDLLHWLEGLATQLVSIHRHPARTFPWRHHPWTDPGTLIPPSWSRNRRLWERAIDFVLTTRPRIHEVFIHRDFHPTNILWHRGSVSGVVDWINACRGPAGVDVAHCRTNLALIYGAEAADWFLRAYMNMSEWFAYDPYWDVHSVFEVGLPQPVYYAPWKDFGLEAIGPDTLRNRLEAHLEHVLRHV